MSVAAGEPPAPGAAASPRRTALALGAVLFVFFLLVQLRVKATNFAGFDEWVHLWLASKGILGIPHHNRPLPIAWMLPAVWLWPASFSGFYWIHFAYLLGTGWLVYVLVRLVAPQDELLAYLAAAFSLVWAPATQWRLDAALTTMHSSAVFGALAAALLFAAAWRRASPPLAAAGAALAFAVVRSYEALMPMLLGVPLPLVLGDRARRRSRSSLLAIWWSVAGLASLLALWPGLTGQSTYQGEYYRLDARPASVAARLAELSGLAFRPLVEAPPDGASRAFAATAVFVVGCVLARRARLEPRALARVAGLGLATTFALELPFVLTDMHGGAADRAQVVAAPGTALLLAALVRSLGLGRVWLSGLLAGWVTFLGAAHVFRQQDVWDAASFYPAQRRSLAGLVREVPDVEPHTLIALLDTTGAWPASFPFHHAVDFVYQGRAAGYVAAVPQPLYLVRFDADGVRFVPHPLIAEGWGVVARTYRYDELVVAVALRDGVHVLPEWPAAGLPPLPPGARYDPRSRVEPLSAPIPERRVLSE